MNKLVPIINPTEALLILLISSITLIGLPSASAAGSDSEIEKTPLPAGPLLRKMPDPSAWKITYAYDSDKKDPVTGIAGLPPSGNNGSLLGGAVRSITVKRAGTSWVAVTEDVMGHQIEQCSVDGMQFLTDSKKPNSVMNTPMDENHQPLFGLRDFTDGSFPELGWVSPADYQGKQKFQGVTYLVFGHAGEGADAKNGLVMAPRAWVNAETRLPVTVTSGNSTITFQQLPTPQLPLDLPAKVKSVTKAIKETGAIFLRPIPRGG